MKLKFFFLIIALCVCAVANRVQAAPTVNPESRSTSAAGETFAFTATFTVTQVGMEEDDPNTYTVEWSNTLLTYTGNPQAPAANASNSLGATIEVTVTGGQTNVGGPYTATSALTVPNPGITLTNTTTTFTIARATVPVEWGNTTLTYTGSPIRPSATATGVKGENLPLAFAGMQTNVGGTYTATASLNPPNNNYTLTNTTTTFSITQATVPVVWENTTLVYTGNPQAPTATATGVKSENLPLTVTGEQTNVGGPYTATAALATSDNNYTLSNTTVTFEIIGSVTGMEDLLMGQIVVYPNPTKGELKIENGDVKMKHVEVFDITGKKQLSTINAPLTTSIDISHLPAGVYFVRISTETGELVMKVFKE